MDQCASVTIIMPDTLYVDQFLSPLTLISDYWYDLLNMTYF